jgi:hypothetical protein
MMRRTTLPGLPPHHGTQSGLLDEHSERLPTERREKPMLPDKQNQAYEAFYESTVHNKILDPKTTVMIQLAASFVMGCYP